MSDKDYSVFGLKVRSVIPLPELHRATHSGHVGSKPDVLIAPGRVESPGEGQAGLHMHGSALTLVVPGVGRFSISGGAEIIVDAEEAASPRNVRLYLLGSAFGALLHQRGLLPLHANAIAVEGKTVAYMGPSGEGKSTLAAWFHDRGYQVVADDVCAIIFDHKENPSALPGLPRLRLWKDALYRSGRDHQGYEQSYGGSVYEKYDVPIGPESSSAAALPLGAVYLLQKGENFGIRRLDGVAALEAVMSNVYRGEFLEQTKRFRNNWEDCVRLIARIPVFACTRTWDEAWYEDEARKMLDHATDCVRESHQDSRFQDLQ